MTNRLFETNSHGDIWQEPTLFDQGSESTGASVETTAADTPRRVEIIAGPYAGRFGTVDWVDDLVACVDLEPLHRWDGEQHMTFLHGYYR